jgi:hypothetical protein
MHHTPQEVRGPAVQCAKASLAQSAIAAKKKVSTLATFTWMGDQHHQVRRSVPCCLIRDQAFNHCFLPQVSINQLNLSPQHIALLPLTHRLQNLVVKQPRSSIGFPWFDIAMPACSGLQDSSKSQQLPELMIAVQQVLLLVGQTGHRSRTDGGLKGAQGCVWERAPQQPGKKPASGAELSRPAADRVVRLKGCTGP